MNLLAHNLVEINQVDPVRVITVVQILSAFFLVFPDIAAKEQRWVAVVFVRCHGELRIVHGQVLEPRLCSSLAVQRDHFEVHNFILVGVQVPDGRLSLEVEIVDVVLALQVDNAVLTLGI